MKQTLFYLAIASLSIMGLIIMGCSSSGSDETEEQLMTEQESEQIALQYLLDSPTYLFDGIDGSVNLEKTLTAKCPSCWVFEYEFESSHAGFGNRNEQVLAQVITTHTVSISVEQGTVKSATMDDDEWDMMAQAQADDQDQSTVITDTDPDDSLVGGTPGSCGYSWNEERYGWHRMWDDQSFIPADQKPEWKKHIPSAQVVTAVRMNQSNSGEVLDLSVGDSIIVTLESNPSTGFSWQLAIISDETVLENSAQEFGMIDTNSPPGTPGEEIWTFEAIGPGTCTFVMEYSRPWEGGEKGVETFSLTVTVEGNAATSGSSDTSSSNNKWNLISLGDKSNPQSVIEGTNITIELDIEGDTINVNGSAGCNSYFGNYEYTNEGLKSGMFGVTERYCMNENVMDQEYEYLSALGKVTLYEIDGDSLTMTYEDGVLIFSII